MTSLKDSLIAHYRLNDDLATDVIIDETGNHNGAVKDTGGTATSAFHSVTGKINKAQNFEGTDDYIAIPDHIDFTPALTPFSISAWVNMHSATAFVVASKGGFNVAAEWKLALINSKIYFYLYDDSEGSYISRFYTTVLNAYENQWIHFVATYDGGTSSSGIKIYLNGLQVDNASFNTGTFVAVENLNHVVRIGRGKTVYADGLIDIVMFFSKELTLSEVRYLYNFNHGRESFLTLIELSRTGHSFSSRQEI